MPVATAARPANRPAKSATRAARIRAWRLHPKYDPRRYRLHATDRPVTLPGGRGGLALLIDLLVRRTWVIAIDNADDGPVRVDRWDLFSAAADVSADMTRVPTVLMLRAVAAAVEFFGLDGHEQA